MKNLLTKLGIVTPVVGISAIVGAVLVAVLQLASVIVLPQLELWITVGILGVIGAVILAYYSFRSGGHNASKSREEKTKETIRNAILIKTVRQTLGDEAAEKLAEASRKEISKFAKKREEEDKKRAEKQAELDKTLADVEKM